MREGRCGWCEWWWWLHACVHACGRGDIGGGGRKRAGGEMVVVVVSEHAGPHCHPPCCHCHSHSRPLHHLVVTPPRCHCCHRHCLCHGIGHGRCVIIVTSTQGRVVVVVGSPLLLLCPSLCPSPSWSPVVVVLPLPLVVSLSLSS